MADLKSILKNDIDRTIDGVIKADYLLHIRQEVEEYVLTHEVAKHLDKLISGYRESIDQVSRGKSYPYNGVWISGYFGSGKSHLLKMLAYVFENKEIEGIPLADLFSPKIEDQMLKANLKKIVEVPSHSILFNIDQEADAKTAGDENALIYIFEKVFNRYLGYFAYDRNIAELERHLDDEGKYDKFKEDYERIIKTTWVKSRKTALSIGRPKLVKVICESMGMSEEDARGLIDHYQKGSSISVESFVQRIREWLDRHEDPSFRLNFFIDEVGQFIAGKTRLMLNLQTLAETLGTVCNGRVWVFVTSQEDLVSVVGDPTARQVQDFSKINARFYYRISLSSADVQEVIQKRLLDKTVDGSKTLGDMYMKEKETFRTLFRFESGGRQILFKDKNQFILSYPFQAYQYDLLQQALRGLSEHNAFRGQHISQGERSMLEIFQDVSRRLKDEELFVWATFDQMFEGIRLTLNTGLINAINAAEQNLNDPVAIKLLKILLLVKYVRVFKATHDHLKILLIRELDEDLAGLDRKISEALNILEHQTYIQRNGMIFEYLTNEEKDVENEIKQVEIGHDDTRKFIGETVFSGILRLPSSKIRDDEIKEDYTFTRIIDGESLGRSADLGIHLITPNHPNYEDRTTILNQAMGKKEMLVILDADADFQRDLRLYFQTDIYCRQHNGMEDSSQIQRIINDKLHQNNERKSTLKEQLNSLLATATIYVMVNQLPNGSSEPAQRILTGFKSLLKQSYPKLRFLGTHHYVEADLKKYLYPSDSAALFSGDATEMNEAEKEMSAFIQMQFADRENLSLKRLIETFSYGQFGWYHWGIICTLARIYSREKVELIQGNAAKSRDEIFGLLSGGRDYDQVRVKPVEDIDDKSLVDLQKLHRTLFNRELPNTGPKKSAIAFKEILLEIAHEVENWLQHDLDQYQFLEHIRPLAEYLRGLCEREWVFFLNNQPEYADSLKKRCHEELEPLREFMNGNQKDLWKELYTFYSRNRDNLLELGKSDKLGLLQEQFARIPYREGVLRDLKKDVRDLQEELQTALDVKKKESFSYLDKLVVSFEVMEPFSELEEQDRKNVKAPLEKLKQDVEKQTQLAMIRDIASTKGPRALEEALVAVSKILDPEKRIVFASSAEKKVPFNKATLETEADVISYIDALKARYLELIRKEKRITL